MKASYPHLAHAARDRRTGDHAGDRTAGPIGHLVAALLLIAFVVAALPSCSPEDPFVPTRTSDTTNRKKGAFLRVINAAANGPQVDVLVDGKKLFASPQGYLDFTERNNNARYYPVDSNAHMVTFMAGGQKMAESPLTLRKDAYYTAYFHGSARSGFAALVTDDTISISTVPGKSVKYRVVNLAPDAPSVDIKQDSANTMPVASNLAYGTASPYVASSEHLPPKGTGLWIYDHATGKELRALTPPYIILPPNATFTIVLTGNTEPRGDDAFLNFSLFQESYHGADSLYGSPPINVNFCAVRFANIVATRDDFLDVTFYDPAQEFCFNDNFRRNLVGQMQTVESIVSLGHFPQPPERDYFYISMLLRQDYPFRVEYHDASRIGRNCVNNVENLDYRKQDVLVPRAEFGPEVNRRYTVVAYGPYAVGSAASTVLQDNTPAPPAGMAQVRFFHGAFGAPYETKRLRLRIAVTTTPTAVAYGEKPDGTNSFATGPGTVTAQVVDESNAVIHTQQLTLTPLEANKSYTIFLSRGSFGDALYLHALAEELNR